MSTTRRKRILAVASGGGHWVQLLRLRPAFEGHDVAFVTARETYREDLAEGTRLHVINDATRWDKIGQVKLCLKLLWILLRERPSVVISTGAAPGYFALVFGKLMFARTIWVDSIANAEEISMTGRMVRRFADMWLTQWPHLETPEGPAYKGAVL